MKLAFANHQLVVELNEGEAAAQLRAALPLTVDMVRWGDALLAHLPVPVGSMEKRREVFAVGDVALWPDDNAFCIFFGPTPVSHADEPRMASPGIALGKVIGDAAVFNPLGRSLRVRLLPADG